MATSSIPVDVTNPGQVFACLGLVEATLRLCGTARAAFDWRDPIETRFVVESAGEHRPAEVALEFLANASVNSLAPHGSSNDTRPWQIRTEHLAEDAPFPFDDPASPATLPAVLTGRVSGGTQVQIMIDYWGDRAREDNVKFWGGGAGYPGARLVYDAIELVRDRWRDAVPDPFALAAPQSSSFRFDWRRDYIPIDAGFSLNSHSGNRFTTVGYPLVELLASIGLTYARPRWHSALEYEYGIVGTSSDRATIDLLSPALLRTALGSDELPFHRRRFRMRLDWPGKEGQSRAITIVTEEMTR